MFPSMLGSRGHAYLLVLILSVLYTGRRILQVLVVNEWSWFTTTTHYYTGDTHLWTRVLVRVGLDPGSLGRLLACCCVT